MTRTTPQQWRKYISRVFPPLLCAPVQAHARIQEFSSGGGGGPGQSDKKALTFFVVFLVLSLFYRSQVANSKENYYFKVPEGGGQLFPGGRGRGVSNCLFPVEIHRLWDFPAGSGPPVPPSGPALEAAKTTDMKQNTIKSKRTSYVLQRK